MLSLKRTLILFSLLITTPTAFAEQAIRMALYSVESAQVLRTIGSNGTVLFEICNTQGKTSDEILEETCEALEEKGLSERDLPEFSLMLELTLKQKLNGMNEKLAHMDTVRSMSATLSVFGAGLTASSFLPSMRTGGSFARFNPWFYLGVTAIGSFSTIKLHMDVERLSQSIVSLATIIAYYSDNELSDDQVRELEGLVWDHFVEAVRETLSHYIVMKYSA